MAPVRRSARLSTGGPTSAAPEAPKTATVVAKRSTAAKTAKAAKPAAPPAAPRKRKTAPADAAAEDHDTAELPPRPSTPPPKKRRGRPAANPPAPAPAAPATPSTPRPRHPAVERLASADVTNAPLLSPETSRVVSVLPPTALSALSAGRSSILDDAHAHLVRVNPRLRPIIEAKPCNVFSAASLAEPVDPFESLASGIISQQVSGAAARAIKGRFVALFARAEGHAAFPQPSQVAAASIERLRTAGLSQRKAEYLQGLAGKFVSGELSTGLLAEAPYETLVERLVAVRGLGLWSVEMFAVFGLKRVDVFSVGDLGVQRGMAAFAGRDVGKLKRAGGSGTKKNAKWKYMTEQEMLAMAEPYKPYRSVFMWYMWQVESVDVSTMG